METFANGLIGFWMSPMLIGQAWTDAWLKAWFSGRPEIDRDLARVDEPGGAQLPVPNPHQIDKDRTLFA